MRTLVQSTSLAGCFLLVALFAGSAAEAADPRHGERPQPLQEHPTLQEMLRVNNELRRRVGLPPHIMSPELTRAAQDHAWYMARTGDFRHEGNGGPMARVQRHGFYGLVRENIAAGQMSVASAFDSWSTSSGHWASIISSTTQVGFGYAIGVDGTPYWVAVYGD